MALPPLYKYLDLAGAKLTLGNRTFKHAKPSDFNDLEDMTIQSIFPEDVETALTKLATGLTDVVVKYANSQPTCPSPLREKIAILQKVYRENPAAAEAVKAEVRRDPTKSFDIEHMRAMSGQFVKEINDFMQGYRVLCVSKHRDSDRMWTRYAGNHGGIVLRIEPCVEKDSKFQLFYPIQYRSSRPPLYDDTLEFLASGLFSDQQRRRLDILDKIAYAKTLEWEYEGEYRLVIPVRSGESWNIMPYHPEEITEVHLGAAMAGVDRGQIVEMAKAVNTKIAVFYISRAPGQRLKFDKL
jgi:hypothetical protein